MQALNDSSDKGKTWLEQNETNIHVSLEPWLKQDVRGLSQEVVDFFYNKKTTQSIAIIFYL